MRSAVSTLSRVVLCATAALVPALAGAQAVVGTLGVGSSPQSVVVDPLTHKAYVADNASDDVAIIDGKTGAVKLVGVGFAPSALAIDPFTRRVYVGTVSPGAFAYIDAGFSAMADSATTLLLGGGSATAFAVNPATGRTYVLDGVNGLV